MTPLQLHIADWKHCQRCDLHMTRKRTVLVRGTIPCEVLFVGEAPGESEDVIGKPFIGPAGKLLDQIIAASLPEGATYAITNLVACIPRSGEGKKAEEPLPEEVEACSFRLQHLVALCSPSLIVAVGSLARDYLDPKMQSCVLPKNEIPIVNVLHPAYILRLNIAQQGLAIQRCIVAITNAVEGV